MTDVENEKRINRHLRTKIAKLQDRVADLEVLDRGEMPFSEQAKHLLERYPDEYTLHNVLATLLHKDNMVAEQAKMLNDRELEFLGMQKIIAARESEIIKLEREIKRLKSTRYAQEASETTEPNHPSHTVLWGSAS